jgi:peptidyl-prolyl cis-trans isomerase C
MSRWSNCNSLAELTTMVNKRLIALLALLVGAASSPSSSSAAAESTSTAAAAAAKPAELFADTVVAKGKGVEVKRSQLDEALVSIKATAAARGQSIPPEHVGLFEQQVLERMVQIQLLLAKATDPDKTAGKDNSAKRFDEMKTRAGSEETMNRQLKSVGLTQDELKKRMVEEATAQVVLERELKISVAEDDVKKFYDDNPSKFEQPEMVRASHILIGTQDPASKSELPDDKKAAKHKLAEDLVKRARAGEDFAKLVKEFSDDPGSKDQGGEYTFPRGKMMPEFEAAAFALKPNDVSDIVTTSYGYHIIKLSEKIPAKKVELTKVSPDIKEYLKGQIMQKQLPDYMDQLKKAANLEILDEKLKPAETPGAGTLPAGHPAVDPGSKPDKK